MYSNTVVKSAHEHIHVTTVIIFYFTVLLLFSPQGSIQRTGVQKLPSNISWWKRRSGAAESPSRPVTQQTH